MGGKPLAWIVDDDDEMNQAVRLMLELLGYDVETYLDARGAVPTLLSGAGPEVIVLDINMPEVSGLDMLEFVRRRSDLNNVAVVMLSTETADVKVDEAVELGADGFVFKPVTLDELEEAINKAVAARRSPFVS